MRERTKETKLKLDLTVGEIKKFINDIPDNAKFEIHHAVKGVGFNFDNLSYASYDEKNKKVNLITLDTAVIMGLDEIMPMHDSIKKAFTVKQKRIKRLVYEI